MIPTKLCDYCNSVIPTYKKTNKYCNHHCAASHSNSIKWPIRKCKFCDNPLVGKHAFSLTYCSRDCSQNYKWKLKKEEIQKTGWIKTAVGGGVAKRYLKELRGHKCEICGGSEWFKKPMPLVLDHINGNSEDWNVTNLRFVCGNCDMQLPTYKSKNTGNGRAYRRKRYDEGKSY